MLQLALLADAQVQEVLPLQLQGLLVGLGAAARSPRTVPQPGPSTRPPTLLALPTVPDPAGVSLSVFPASLGSSPSEGVRVPEAAGSVWAFAPGWAPRPGARAPPGAPRLAPAGSRTAPGSAARAA